MAAVKPLLWEFSVAGIQLTKFAAPEEFEIGWEKQLVEHKTLTPNGISRIDTHILGIYPIPTSWKGTFYGANALSNFQQLERLATQPADVIFVYGPLKYNVQVSKVVGRPKSPIEIQYDFSITVKSVITQNSVVANSNPTFDISTQTFLDNGDTAFSQLSVTTLPANCVATYNAQKSQTQAASPLRDAPYPVLVSLALAVQAFNTAMYAYLASQELKRLDASGNTNLLNALTTYQNYSQFYLALQTLIGGQAGSNAQIVAEANTNLFAISQQFYPNLTAADGAALIAQANGLADYFIDEETTLVIPAPTS